MRLTSAGLRRLAVLLIFLLGSSGCRAAAEVPTPFQTQPNNPTPLSTLAGSPAISQPTSVKAADVERPVDDLRIRQAIAACTDRTALLNAAYPWLQDPSAFLVDSFISPWDQTAQKWGSNLFQYDPEKGKALLESAGWKLPAGAQYIIDSDGRVLTLQLVTTTTAVRRAWTEAFIDQMKVCGMKVTVEYQEATLFYKDKDGTLARGDFDLAAFAWVFWDAANGSEKIYRCDEIPGEKNDWIGQNFAGWCNTRADGAARLAAGSLNATILNTEMAVIQEEYARDLPGIPLFARPEVMAANPDLMNFAPDVNELYTWNAADWAIPGKNSIVIGERSEPTGLAIFETSYVAQLIRALVYGLDTTHMDGGYQPAMLISIPSLQNGGAIQDAVDVKTGDRVVDATGNPVELQPGIRLYDLNGEEINFQGMPIQLGQLKVHFEFVDGLRWSDGEPVVRGDYQLGYAFQCNPLAADQTMSSVSPECGKIASIEFESDTAYSVIWKPGYRSLSAFLPPLSRLPAHQVLSDGRKLGDVPAEQLAGLDEVIHPTVGTGPFQLERWEYGEAITFKANPFYYKGLPNAKEIKISLIGPPEELQERLLNGLSDDRLDLVGWDSLSLERVDDLLAAEKAGRVKLFILPSSSYEQVTFGLKRPD